MSRDDMKIEISLPTYAEASAIRGIQRTGFCPAWFPVNTPSVTAAWFNDSLDAGSEGA